MRKLLSIKKRKTQQGAKHTFAEINRKTNTRNDKNLN